MQMIATFSLNMLDIDMISCSTCLYCLSSRLKLSLALCCRHNHIFILTNTYNITTNTNTPIHQHPSNQIQVIHMRADRTLRIYVNFYQNAEILILILTFIKPKRKSKPSKNIDTWGFVEWMKYLSLGSLHCLDISVFCQDMKSSNVLSLELCVVCWPQCAQISQSMMQKCPSYMMPRFWCLKEVGFAFLVCRVFGVLLHRITKQVSGQNSAICKFDEVHECLEVLFAFSYWFFMTLSRFFFVRHFQFTHIRKPRPSF